MHLADERCQGVTTWLCQVAGTPLHVFSRFCADRQFLYVAGEALKMRVVAARTYRSINTFGDWTFSVGPRSLRSTLAGYEEMLQESHFPSILFGNQDNV